MLNILSSLLFIVIAILILGVCVVIHEFGHYILARATGIDVVEFSVGMGPKIAGFRRKGIDYSWRAIPLGGYCKFVGEDEDSDDPKAFNNHKLWKRFLTVFAGPTFNVILAIILATVMYASNSIYESVPKIYTVYEESAAADAGLMPGDVIEQVNGVKIGYKTDGVELLRTFITEDEMTLSIRRGETRSEVKLTPKMMMTEGDARPSLMIGIVFDSDHPDYAPVECFTASVKLIGQTAVLTVDYLKDLILNLFKGILPKSDELAGPVGIVSSVSSEVKTGFSMGFGTGIINIIYWLLVITVNLGIMNLLPFPALDGGRILFLLYELIRRKKVNQDRIGVINLIGFGIMIVIIILITGSDILALFRR